MNDYMKTILEKVLTDDLPNVPVPKALYHYTSLEIIQKILEFDNVRLSHAEYSNDRRELHEAINLIRATLASAAPSSAPTLSHFYRHVDSVFNSRVTDFDVYIFCMCEGLSGAAHPQDMLSQWRAYAQDGRGGAITLDKKGLDNVVGKLRGLRVNPVFYDASLKATFVNAILAEGFRRHGTPGSPAIDETVRALLYCAPLMKHEGFSEEREWRLIYVSPANVALPRIHFHPRRDFLAPYLDLNDFWATHPPSSALDPPPNIPGSVGKPLVLSRGVMVGPSGHQDLNVRTMTKVVSQFAPGAIVEASQIPYRSLG